MKFTTNNFGAKDNQIITFQNTVIKGKIGTGKTTALLHILNAIADDESAQIRRAVFISTFPVECPMAYYEPDCKNFINRAIAVLMECKDNVPTAIFLDDASFVGQGDGVALQRKLLSTAIEEAQKYNVLIFIGIHSSVDASTFVPMEHFAEAESVRKGLTYFIKDSHDRSANFDMINDTFDKKVTDALMRINNK